jgi:hypothetical protein
MTNLKHRGSKRRFSIHEGKTKVEIFWHHGYKRLGAVVIHLPTGEWDMVFGSRRTLIPKIRQLATWLAFPEVRQRCQPPTSRILG